MSPAAAGSRASDCQYSLPDQALGRARRRRARTRSAGSRPARRGPPPASRRRPARHPAPPARPRCRGPCPAPPARTATGPSTSAGSPARLHRHPAEQRVSDHLAVALGDDGQRRQPGVGRAQVVDQGRLDGHRVVRGGRRRRSRRARIAGTSAGSSGRTRVSVTNVERTGAVAQSRGYRWAKGYEWSMRPVRSRRPRHASARSSWSAGPASVANPTALRAQAKRVTDRVGAADREGRPDACPPSPRTLVGSTASPQLAAGSAAGDGPLHPARGRGARRHPGADDLAGHPFWTVKDPAERRHHETHFLKNLGLLGGLLLAAADTQGKPGPAPGGPATRSTTPSSAVRAGRPTDSLQRTARTAKRGGQVARCGRRRGPRRPAGLTYRATRSKPRIT